MFPHTKRADNGLHAVFEGTHRVVVEVVPMVVGNHQKVDVRKVVYGIGFASLERTVNESDGRRGAEHRVDQYVAAVHV